MTLLELQRDMRAWLTTGTEDTMFRFAPSARTGLAVYQNNYRAQLVACLADTFQRVKAWLGDDDFLAAAVSHINSSPPSDWTLDHYGRTFAESLRARYAEDPEVAELAWLDRALADAFVGPDIEPVPPHSLAAIDWDRAVLRFTPTLQIGHVLTNSTMIWSALSAGSTPPAVEWLPNATAALVWRKEFTSCFRTLTSIEERAIMQVYSGASFGALCAMLVTTQGDIEGVKVAGEFLAQWLRDGLIVGVDEH
jgi:Putative DNA-binding domain